MSTVRARAYVLLLAVAAFLNTLGNGFAYDDNWFIVENPVVTEGRMVEAFTEASWPGATEGTGNYRPLALVSFGAEWRVFSGHPAGFHLVSLLAHAVVSLLVLGLLSRFLPLRAALVGAAFFAVHPVHVEAVANVMGRSELYAAMAYLSACLVYLDAQPRNGRGRGLRLSGLVGLFLLALGSKEIAITLPGVLVALECYRTSNEALRARLARELPTYIALGGVLAAFILVRWNVLGDLTGEVAAPGLRSLSTPERLMTALSIWPEYLRLIVFPFDLSADYAPAVVLMARRVTWEVVLGLMLLVATVAGAVRLRARSPAGLGLAWFFLAVLPVSNLLVRADVLLAERTLYLPSVGAAFVVGAAAAHVLGRGGVAARRTAGLLAAAGCIALMIRTVTRNPAWLDTYTVVNTLAMEHPESWLAQRARGSGLARVGDNEQATEAYTVALRLAPDHYGLAVEVAEFYDRIGAHDQAEELLAQAIRLLPEHPGAHRRLAEQRLRRGDGRGGHAAALAGLARAGFDRELWSLVSESYLAKGDLIAAVRAKRAALSDPNATRRDWSRLAEIYDALGDAPAAIEARAVAATIPEASGASRSRR